MREMVIAGDAVDDDWYIVEADYSGIEAIQVGHYAADPDYIRMAKLGVHSFYAASLPQINIHLDPKWDDVQLAAGIKDVKKLAKSINSEGTETPIYDVAKRIVHGSNYWMLEGLMHDSYPESFPTRAIAKQYQDRYFELFPKIRPWQLSVCQQADDQNCLINDFGYRRWFWNAMKWMYNNRLGKWEYVPSGDAKKAVATLPQSSAAAIIRRAMLSSAFQELVAQQLAMLQIHDSLVCRARSHQVEFVKQKLTEAMIYPIAEQGGLTIPIEIKVGKTWRGYDKLKCPLGMKEV
jgi:DNA polymerase I-like protein with 3'-5' exonuclease and polymerase domains